MYSVLLSKRTKTLFTSPILNPIKTPVANKSKTNKIRKWLVRASRKWLKPERWPGIMRLWADKGSYWSYALLKWEQREKEMDAILGPRQPDQYAAKLVVEKFKEEDAPIQEWEEDIASSDPLAEPPFNRTMRTWRRRMRRKKWQAHYARLIGKFSQPAMYLETRNMINEKSNAKQINEEEVERRENIILSLINPLASITKKLWQSNYELIRERELLFQSGNAMSQISRLIEVALPSSSELARQSKLREQHDYYADKILEAVKTPPPGQTQVYPYSFSPAGYQQPQPSILHPYDKLPYKDSNNTNKEEYSITPSNSFQLKNDLQGSIWNSIKNQVNSYVYSVTGIKKDPESPLSYSQKIEENIYQNSKSSTKETSLVPVEPEEDAPRFLDFVNPNYSTFKMFDFKHKHRDIKIATLKDYIPDLSKQNLRLEVIYGLFPKLLSILYGQFNPIDIVKYCDPNLAARLLNKSRKDFMWNITSFHKIVRILKARFYITRRKSRRLRLRVTIRSIESLARRRLNKPFFGNVHHLYYYKTKMWFAPNPMEPFKWKIIRFKRKRRHVRRRISDPHNHPLMFFTSKVRTRVRRPKRMLTKRKRRTLKRKLKKIRRAMGYTGPPDSSSFTPEQRQTLKEHIRWPGRFTFATHLEDKEYAEYMKQKFGITDQAEIELSETEREELREKAAAEKLAEKMESEEETKEETNKGDNAKQRE